MQWHTNILQVKNGIYLPNMEFGDAILFNTLQTPLAAIIPPQGSMKPEYHRKSVEFQLIFADPTVSVESPLKPNMSQKSRL